MREYLVFQLYRAARLVGGHRGGRDSDIEPDTV